MASVTDTAKAERPARPERNQARLDLTRRLNRFGSSRLGGLIRAGVRPDLEVLLRQFFWPLMGVVFLSLLLPLGIKLVQMARRRRQGAAPA